MLTRFNPANFQKPKAVSLARHAKRTRKDLAPLANEASANPPSPPQSLALNLTDASAHSTDG